MDVKAAVVILNWNGSDLLKTFLPSVIKYTQIPDVKIYVADNNSTDDSINVIKENFSDVEIIKLDKNYGFAGGYNIALEKIDAEFFVLLNSDVEVTENWLNPLLELMTSDPSVAVCMPKILSYTNKDEFEYAGAAGGFIDKFGFIFCRGRLFNVMEKDKNQYDYPSEIFWASGACMIIRADLYKKVGGLDEDFFAHMEEIDLCWRLKNVGYKIMYTPDSKVYHLGGATLNKTNPRKTYLNFRNNLYLLYKNLPSKKLCRKFLIRMFLDGVAGLKFLVTLEFKNFISVVKAHGAFYCNLRSLRRKRKTLNSLKHNENTNGVFNKSIVYQFFIKKKRYFSDLNPNDFIMPKE
ncbi:MAG: glycosyltransferase family 2 protein [Marinilabiliales bacterium]